MVGYGTNKVAMILFRVLCLFPVNKSSIEFKPIQIPTNSMKSMFLCSKSITKEFRICLFRSPRDPKKVTKSGNIKRSEFTLKDYLNIMLTPMKLLRKRWKKEAEIDPSRLLKWMLPPVVHIQSFQSSSNKRKWLKAKSDKSFPLFIWSISLVVRKSEKQVPQETD